VAQSKYYALTTPSEQGGQGVTSRHHSEDRAKSDAAERDEARAAFKHYVGELVHMIARDMPGYRFEESELFRLLN